MPDKTRDTTTSKPHYTGHRQRLRERFAKAGAQGIADYELLELVLFRAIPRRDVKPFAKNLIERFGSFGAVLAAAPARLLEIKGVSDAVVSEFKIVQAAALSLSQSQILNRPALSSWAALIDYCNASMAYNETEQFRILFLDRKNVLIADEIQQKGTIDHTPVYPREVIKRALELGASALILVHNHPSGDPTPSQADIDMTRLIIESAKPLGVSVHDHLVIGKGSHASFKSLGLI